MSNVREIWGERVGADAIVLNTRPPVIPSICTRLVPWREGVRSIRTKFSSLRPGPACSLLISLLTRRTAPTARCVAARPSRHPCLSRRWPVPHATPPPVISAAIRSEQHRPSAASTSSSHRVPDSFLRPMAAPPELVAAAALPVNVRSRPPEKWVRLDILPRSVVSSSQLAADTPPPSMRRPSRSDHVEAKPRREPTHHCISNTYHSPRA
jgi:hypothetical protein